MIWTKAFWKGVTERALKTGIQVFATLVTAQAFDITTFDWATAGKLVLGAVVASVVTSLANPTFVAGEQPTTKEQNGDL